VGFRNHETFSRACRRYFRASPHELREAGIASKQQVIANHQWSPEGCILSSVRFQVCPPMTLLSIRHAGGYSKIPEAFIERDRLWRRIVTWAEERGIRYKPVALCIFCDNPWLTPEDAHRRLHSPHRGR
jgi:hypothetical protein